MNCPYCGNEMEKGELSITTTQGLSPMILSYASMLESKKGIFSRKTQDKIISSGEKSEAYRCSSCKKIIPVFNIG